MCVVVRVSLRLLNECVCAEWTVYCDLDRAVELKVRNAEHHVLPASSGTAEFAVGIFSYVI